VKFVQANNPGVTFQLHRSTKKPLVLLLYETFPSQASLDVQQKSVLPAFIKEAGATPEDCWQSRTRSSSIAGPLISRRKHAAPSFRRAQVAGG